MGELDLDALRRLDPSVVVNCECVPRRGDHDYGLGGPIGCSACAGTGMKLNGPAIIAALERVEALFCENEELHVQVVGKALHAEQMEAAANSARAALEDGRPDIAQSILRAALTDMLREGSHG